MRPPDEQRGRPGKGDPQTKCSEGILHEAGDATSYILCSPSSAATTTTTTGADLDVGTVRPLGRDWFLDWLNSGHESWWTREQRWKLEGRWQ
jgi:hypothetical protein